MDVLFKRILFFVLMPIFGPLMLFSHLTYPWWMKLQKGSFFQKVLYYILTPVYGPITFFLYLTYDWWAELIK